MASQHATFPFFQWREAPDPARVGENPRIKAGKVCSGQWVPVGRQGLRVRGTVGLRRLGRARKKPQAPRGHVLPFTPAHPQTKIVLLFPLDKRQQLAEAAAGPFVRPVRPTEDPLGTPTCFPAVAPMLRGAGDGVDRREGARAREMKRILVLLLQLDARLQEEGRRVGGRPGGGAKVPQCWQPLYAHVLTQRDACGEGDPREEQPRKRRRCPRPRP